MYAAKKGHLEVVKLLVAHRGVDVNAQNKVSYSFFKHVPLSM